MAEVRRKRERDTARSSRRRWCRTATRRGQGTLEYVVLIVVVVTALLAMQLYMKRGVQGKLRSSTDDIGEQFSPTAYHGNFLTTQNSGSQETVHVGSQVAGESKSDANVNVDGFTGLTSNRTTQGIGEVLTDVQANDKTFQ